jgi:hypothetical protein
VRRPADRRHLAQPLAMDGTHECSPALRSDQRSHWHLGVRARSGYSAYGGGRRGRARRRARTRSGVLGVKCISLICFQNCFLQFFKLNCTLASEAKLEIRDPSTTFTKTCRGFVQAMEQEHHANTAKNSAPVNRNRAPSKACFTKNSSKFQMPINSKVVCLNILHIFFFGWF